MFVVMYWWQVKPGKDAQFREGWRRATEAIVKRYGSYGSRLHRAADGHFIAYAMWPSEAAWQNFFDDKTPADPEASALVRDAVAEQAPGGEPVFKLTVTDDLLQAMPAP
jgi:heme-degrading monooxygenase HmoA